jgi:hypothetical protein
MQQARCPEPTAASGEEATGGLGPSVMVLVVSLTIAAIGAYELCGFGLRPLDRRPHLFGDGFATTAVIAAMVAAGAAVGNLAWLLTASHRRATPANGGAAPADDHADDHEDAPGVPEAAGVPDTPAALQASEASAVTDIPQSADGTAAQPARATRARGE